MIEVKDIPTSWRKTLRILQDDAGLDAVIAGGCLRDLDHGIGVDLIKDVDIFVRTGGRTKEQLLELIFLSGLGQPAHVFDEADEGAQEYFDWNRIDLVAQYGGDQEASISGLDFTVTGPHYDVIAMELPGSGGWLQWGDVVTNDFDVGLNRIYFDGLDIVRTSAYVIDRYYKRMTCLRCRNEYELDRIKARIERLIRNKYPKYQPQDVEIKV